MLTVTYKFLREVTTNTKFSALDLHIPYLTVADPYHINCVKYYTSEL